MNETEKKIAVIGKDLPISAKHAAAIFAALKDKQIDEAIDMLEKVQQKKLAIPFKGEIPHRRGMASGRYPVKVARAFIKLLHRLSAAASKSGFETEKLKITAMASRAARRLRAGGRRRRHFKRSHVVITIK